jgi:hypothetical protein
MIRGRSQSDMTGLSIVQPRRGGWRRTRPRIVAVNRAFRSLQRGETSQCSMPKRMKSGRWKGGGHRATLFATPIGDRPYVCYRGCPGPWRDNTVVRLRSGGPSQPRIYTDSQSSPRPSVNIHRRARVLILEYGGSLHRRTESHYSSFIKRPGTANQTLGAVTRSGVRAMVPDLGPSAYNQFGYCRRRNRSSASSCTFRTEASCYQGGKENERHSTMTESPSLVIMKRIWVQWSLHSLVDCGEGLSGFVMVQPSTL